MSGFDLIGAREVGDPAPTPALASREARAAVVSAATVGAGLLGAIFWRGHRVLGLLDGAAVGNNVARLALREITPRHAAESLGAHTLATIGSLSLPSHPFLGYIGPVIASSLVLRRDEPLIEKIEEAVIGAETRRDEAPAASTTRVDYAAFSSGSKHEDDDPVLVRKGVTVHSTGEKDGKKVAVRIPEGTPIFSSLGTGYPPHKAIDYSATWWTNATNLEDGASSSSQAITLRKPDPDLVEPASSPSSSTWGLLAAGLAALLVGGAIAWAAE